VRYAIFGHSFFAPSDPSSEPGGSGIARTPGNDFLVTLDAGTNTLIANACTVDPDFQDAAQCAANVWGTTFDAEWADLQAGTFMHELGHTLGLFHGGNDPKTNFKAELSQRHETIHFNSINLAVAPSIRNQRIAHYPYGFAS